MRVEHEQRVGPVLASAAASRRESGRRSPVVPALTCGTVSTPGSCRVPRSSSTLTGERYAPESEPGPAAAGRGGGNWRGTSHWSVRRVERPSRRCRGRAARAPAPGRPAPPVRRSGRWRRGRSDDRAGTGRGGPHAGGRGRRRRSTEDGAVVAAADPRGGDRVTGRGDARPGVLLPGVRADGGAAPTAAPGRPRGWNPIREESCRQPVRRSVNSASGRPPRPVSRPSSPGWRATTPRRTSGR